MTWKTLEKGWRITAALAALWTGGGAAETLAPELVARRSEVIVVAKLEAVTDAWSIIPLSAWYPKMKDPNDHLVIGLAKFRVSSCLKGSPHLKENVIRAAFPVRGHKAGASKRDTFTMTDFRTLTERHLGTEALWCFQWDPACGSYVIRFPYQQRPVEEAEELSALLDGLSRESEARPEPPHHHGGILEGTLQSVDPKTGSMLLLGGPKTEPITIHTPEWMQEEGAQQLSVRDLQAGDAVRVIALAAPTKEGVLQADDLQLLKGTPYQGVRRVFSADPPAVEPDSSRAKKKVAGAQTGR